MNEPVAVIGIACRFPRADGPDSFWRLLRDGVDAITEIPPDRFPSDVLDTRRYSERTRQAVRWGGLLDGVDQFDPYCFGISPREAPFIDPQHRLLLETAWEALEDAGVPIDPLVGAQAGVFVGLSFNDYEDILFRAPERLGLRVTSGGSRFSAAGRISYALNLLGPSLLVDTACSSSLTAVHLACQSLRQGECPVALAGGVNLMLQPHVNVCLSRGRALAQDGRCKFGDARADGYGRSEGVGVAVLKPLSRALADRDHIHGVILGSAVNHKGRQHGGLVTPSRSSLETVMKAACLQAAIDPRTVQYVEAHGTGTAMGDLAEIPAIAAVIGAGRPAGRRCPIGSVKTNIGHAESASGIAGLIKVLLCFRHRAIPPSLHFQQPNPAIVWDELPVFVQTELADWPDGDGPMRAGVSNFGISGTNVHVVLEQAPPLDRPPDQPVPRPEVLCLSTQSKDSLRQLAARYAQHLTDHAELSLADVCFTANTGRAHFPHRLAVLARSANHLRVELSAFAAGPEEACSRDDLPVAARRYLDGQAVNWAAEYASRAVRKVSLPTYPFQRQRYWIEAPREAGPPVPPDLDAADWLYELRWEPRSVDSPEPAARVVEPQRWLVLADRSGVAAALADRLRARGHACTLVRPAASSDHARPDLCHVDPSRPEHFTRLIQDITTDKTRGAFHAVNLWALDAGPTADLAVAGLNEALRVICGGALHLIRAFAQADEVQRGRLWFVTRGAQPVSDCGIAPGQAPLWGLGRVAALEYPQWWGGLVDLDPAGDPDASASCLLSALERSDGEDEIAYRMGRRHVSRLVRTTFAGHGEEPVRFIADATYLITGGLGRLGLQTARWMAARGARHLILMGRRAASEQARQHIHALQAAGTDVRVWLGDVASEEDLARALRAIRDQQPPLQGVIHAAGVTRFEPLAQMSDDALYEVLHAKVAGAWNLHRQTRDLGLDAFVMFSSGAALWGARNMGHYAAANHFLDALAHHRRSLGLAGLSVTFARLSERGMQSSELEASLAAIGIQAMPIDQAFDALGRLMAEDRVHAALARIDWAIFKPIYAARSRRPLLDSISDAGRAKEPAETITAAPVRAQLTPLSVHDRKRFLTAHIQSELAEVLGFDGAHQVDTDKGFFQLGLDSLSAIRLSNRLEAALECRLPLAVLFEQPCVDALAGFIATTVLPAVEPADRDSPPAAPVRPHREIERAVDGDLRPEPKRELAAAEKLSLTEPIAVVGMACRFPGGANDPDTFWQLLRSGVDAVTEVPPGRWNRTPEVEAIEPPSRSATALRQAGFIDGIDLFDAEFFGIAPREAVDIDPQHRLLMEVAWEALENAAIAPHSLAGTSTGVFVGITGTDYLRLRARANRYDRFSGHTLTGSALNAAAGRLSYFLGLCGPSLAIDTACSSSLVAVHLACQSLRAGECGLALAGGVNAILSPDMSVVAAKAGLLSPTGRCRAFDASADGFVRGEGCGLVVLQRASDAIAAGHRVLALIRGSAVNQDGPRSGFTVPNGLAQQALIADALARARVAPERIGYVEAHGTGTSLGDPIEMRALIAALAEGRDPRRPLSVGSVKTNLGHLESAAGIAGLIKTVLMLQHGMIPPHLHLRDFNPQIRSDGASVVIPTKLTPWPTDADLPRMAGVSSFGASGTNAHVIVEEPEKAAVDAPVEERPPTLCLSARSDAALRQLAGRYVLLLAENPDIAWGDVCFTAATGRSHFPHRFAVVARSGHEAVGPLTTFAAGNEDPDWRSRLTGSAGRFVDGHDVDWAAEFSVPRRRIALPTYPFQRRRFWPEPEPQHAEPAPESPQGDGLLYQVRWHPRGEARADAVAARMPAPAELARFAQARLERLDEQFGLTAYTRLIPELNRLGLAYVRSAWSELGGPRRAGQQFSVAELAEQARIIPAQQRLLAHLLKMLEGAGDVRAAGSAWTVLCDLDPTDPDAHRRRLADEFPACGLEVDLLHHCGRALARILRGEAGALEVLFPDGSLTQLERFYADAPFAAAFNELAVATLAEAAARATTRHPLRILEIGAGTGATTACALQQLPAERLEYTFTDVSPRFLAHARDKFAGVACLRYARLDVEKDPDGQALAGQRFDAVIASNVVHATADLRRTLGHVRQLLSPGGMLLLVEVTSRQPWADLIFGLTDGWWRFADADLRPDYPLLTADRWVELLNNTGFSEASAVRTTGNPLEQSLVIARRARRSMPASRQAPATAASHRPGRWLVLADRTGVADALAARLRARGEGCVLVRADRLEQAGSDSIWHVPPAGTAAFDRLLCEVGDAEALPIDHVVHLGGLDGPSPEALTAFGLEREQARLCGGVLHLLQALARRAPVQGGRVWLVTRGTQRVAGEIVCVSQAPLWGLGRAAAVEFPEIWGGLVDLDPVGHPDASAIDLLAAIEADEGEDQVACRGGRRYAARLDPCRPEADTRPRLTFASDATYLLAGGTGGLARRVARWMIERGARHLALLSRSGPTDAVRPMLDDLGTTGADVRVFRCDLSNEVELRGILEQNHAEMPALRGVIHSAGVLDDDLLARQDWPRFAAAVAPKTLGAWNLHQATSRTPLDFFVLFSSTASLLVMPGQANYAAGNCFLDALAHYRRAIGLPATCINWGTWADTGMTVRRADVLRIWQAQGIGTFPAEFGLRVLEDALLSDRVQVGVFPVDWPKALESFAPGREPSLFRDLRRNRPTSQPSLTCERADADFLVQVQETPPRRRRELLARHLREQAAAVLGLDPAGPLDPGQPLTELGLDSLMAVELRKRLGLSFQRTLPATLLFDHPSLDALSRYLSQRVPELGLRDDDSPRSSVPRDAPAARDEQLMALPLDEMDALLSRKLDAVQERWLE